MTEPVQADERWIRKRGVRGWLAAGAGLLLIGTVLVASASRNPYRFLERFRPKRYSIDLRLFATTGPPPHGEFYLLEFRKDDEEKVMQALIRELTPARGYRVRDFGSGRRVDVDGATTRDRVVDFERSTGFGVDQVEFASGTSAGVLLVQARVYDPEGQVPRDTCVVKIWRNTSSLESSLARLRARMGW